MPSVLMAQVCADPALIATNVPDGGLAWPATLAPQHAAVPLVLMAQVCSPPALILTNVPAGGLA